MDRVTFGVSVLGPELPPLYASVTVTPMATTPQFSAARTLINITTVDDLQLDITPSRDFDVENGDPSEMSITWVCVENVHCPDTVGTVGPTPVVKAGILREGRYVFRAKLTGAFGLSVWGDIVVIITESPKTTIGVSDDPS